MWLDLNWYEYHFSVNNFLYAHYMVVDVQYDYEWTYLISLMNGGGGIRTHGTLADTLVFKTRALNHSTTPPGEKYLIFSFLIISKDG